MTMAKSGRGMMAITVWTDVDDETRKGCDDVVDKRWSWKICDHGC